MKTFLNGNMTYFQFLDSFFGVAEATPYKLVSDEDKNAYLYQLVQRFALGGQYKTLSKIMPLYGMNPVFVCDAMYRESGGIGYKPKWVFVKVSKTLFEFIKANRDKIYKQIEYGLLGEYFKNKDEVVEVIKERKLHLDKDFKKLLSRKIKYA